MQKLMLLGVSLLLSALAMEAMVLVLVGEQPKIPRHVVGGAFGLRINDPNVSYRHKTADVTIYFHINGQGMRANRDYPYAKAEGLKRIVSLGDSFTMGHEVSVEDTFSNVLEQELTKQGYRVEVLNAGVSGYGTSEECLYLERELMKYSPDIIVVSFFGNDLVDNIRTNLFALTNDHLVEENSEYVPLGKFGDFLNRNALLNILSERSNAFSFIKERMTKILKRRVIEDNLKNLKGAKDQGEVKEEGSLYERRLAGAIYDRIYADARAAGIPLIIQSIPFHGEDPEELIEAFPLDQFNVRREGVYFLSGKEVLDPFVGKNQLYWERSDGHWTPFSHLESGRALAEMVVRENLLGMAPNPMVSRSVSSRATATGN